MSPAQTPRLRPRLGTGIFLAPFHPTHEDPTCALRRDIELIEWLDELGYDEAWIGEHHSAAFEIIASPELFIAAAAERTRRIRLGTGVVSLPYHHPLMVTNRIVQLDHMTRGRVMFGAGPGLLPSDAHMLGIPIAKQRDRMAEALDVILRLMAGETVTERTEWYELRDARAHLLPYTRPRPLVAVASTVTPSGGILAGKYGLAMLCTAATESDAFDVLGVNWSIACETAEAHGHRMDRARDLRIVTPMHLAETRADARRQVEYGLESWMRYFGTINPTAMARGLETDRPIDFMIDTGRAVIGTPDDAIAQVERLLKQTGGFGTLLLFAHNWAAPEHTRRSYELLMRHVVPHFDGANQSRAASLAWTTEHAPELLAASRDAARKMIERHMPDRAHTAAGAEKPPED